MLVSFSPHEPTEEARQTIDHLLTDGGSMRLLPTHCINAAGELEGFQLTLPGGTKGGALPINRMMFHGTSLYEVNTKQAGAFNADIVRLQTMDTKQKMKDLMQSIAAEARPASFKCVPENVDCESARTVGKRSVDFADWRPELPHSIGLYQAFCRGYQKDSRVHKLFIGISGGLNRCSDEFYNLMLDVQNEFTCREVAASEEVWWLRKACQRARSRVALLTAEHFGLDIAKTTDLFSYHQDATGVAVADTIEFDIREGPDDTVEFYSACVDTTSIQNGILAKMHESEGVWVFRGSARSSAKTTSFGSLFGTKAVCGVFPTRSPYYKRHNGSPSHVNGLDSDLVVRHETKARTKPDDYVFQCFDEPFFSKLAAMQWDRNCGVVELVPVVVGVS